jgi:hypothetical protein
MSLQILLKARNAINQIWIQKLKQQSNEQNPIKTVTKENKGRQHTKARSQVSLKIKWESKAMHGLYIRSIDRKLISEKDMFLWPS